MLFCSKQIAQNGWLVGTKVTRPLPIFGRAEEIHGRPNRVVM